MQISIRILCSFIMTSNFKNAMYPRSFFYEEAKIKQHILHQRKNFVIRMRKKYGNPDSESEFL